MAFGMLTRKRKQGMRSYQHLQIEGNAMADQEGQDRDEDIFYLKNCLCAGGSHSYLQINS